MRTDLIAVPPFWTSWATPSIICATAPICRTLFSKIFVVESRPSLPGQHLSGSPGAHEAAGARRRHHGRGSPPRPASPTTRKEVARLFERYNVVSVPVVDEAERLVGVITIDDIVDVIEEEAD
jgi:magnesium transporter